MLSPKQIGTICLVFSFVFLSTKSFSENIPNNPTCDNSTLGVYSGSVALEPDWGANKIPIRWYNNNTLMTVTNAESTCDYDGDITVPSSPSRTGYNFTGWAVRPQRDFSTLSSTISDGSIRRWSKSERYSDYSAVCYYKEGGGNAVSVDCDSDTNFFELGTHEWKAEFRTGTVYGMAKCSATNGALAVAGDPTDEGAENTKIYCWCKATGWKADGSNTLESSSVPLSWVFDRSYSYSPTTCLPACANACSGDISSQRSFRAALFSSATNNNQ